MQKQNFPIESQQQDFLETSRPIQSSNFTDFQQPNFERAHFGRRRKDRTKKIDVYGIVLKYKVDKLVHNFIRKLRMNSVFREPYDNEDSQKMERNRNFAPGCCQGYVNSICGKEGLELGKIGLMLWSLINIIQIAIMVFVFSIMVAFEQTQKFHIFLYFRIFSIILYILDIVLNLTVKRYENGKHLHKIGEIASCYLRRQFAIDLASVLIFPMDVIFTVRNNLEIFIFLFALMKLFSNIRKLQKLQYIFINTSDKEHYYGLIKVLIANFIIAHFLSIALNFMAEIDQNNWRHKLGIDHQEWYIKYIWGYYWGTNIMFTVGFGDLCATNYYEAIVLVFIQAFSCITLAYNISYVGALISSLKQNEKTKNRKLKIFHQMCKESSVQNEIQAKITNFIEEEYRIKEEYEYEAHDQILKGLPVVLQKEFRQDANRSLFDNLGFLSNLLRKGMVRLTEIVERKVCHPQEIILKRGSAPQFIVLQSGRLSMTCRIRSILDGREMETFEVKDGQTPMIVSFHFIKNNPVDYNLKSNSHSVIYTLSQEQLMDCLRKTSEISLQTYCVMKDKDESALYQNQIRPCSICKTENHNKFQCHRLHYVPLVRNVIFKYLHKVNSTKQVRMEKGKRNKKSIACLTQNRKIKADQKRFCIDKYDEDQNKKIEDLHKFYATLQQSDDVVELIELRNTRTDSNQSKFKYLGNQTYSRFEKFLEYKSNQQSGFWDLECDTAQNFKFYFKESNPEALQSSKKSKRSFPRIFRH